MDRLTERLAACYSGAVHDVLRGMGRENVVLPPSIKPLDPATKLAGPVWTVSGHIDRTRTRDETLLGWCTLLAKAPRGHVVVCQPHNHEVALMGELSAQTLAARGVLGYVVDGGSRDTELIVVAGRLVKPGPPGRGRLVAGRIGAIGLEERLDEPAALVPVVAAHEAVPGPCEPQP